MMKAIVTTIVLVLSIASCGGSDQPYCKVTAVSGPQCVTWDGQVPKITVTCEDGTYTVTQEDDGFGHFRCDRAGIGAEIACDYSDPDHPTWTDPTAAQTIAALCEPGDLSN